MEMLLYEIIVVAVLLLSPILAMLMLLGIIPSSIRNLMIILVLQAVTYYIFINKKTDITLTYIMFTAAIILLLLYRIAEKRHLFATGQNYQKILEEEEKWKAETFGA